MEILEKEENQKVSVVLKNEITKEYLNEFIKQQHLIRVEAHKNKEMGFDWGLEDFINLMRTLPPQNYGTRIQNRVIKNLKFQKCKASEDCGDCLDNFGDNYEIKTSIIDGINIHLNVIKIRPWVKVNYYIIAFDCRPESVFKCYFFRLSKNEMEQELLILKANPSNHTQKSNEDNKNVDLRFSIEIDNESWKRWVNKYLSNASNII